MGGINASSSQWCGCIFILCHTYLKLELLLHKQGLVATGVATTVVKIVIFRTFLFFSERFSSRISARIKCSSYTRYSRNAWRKSPEKRRNVLKMAVLTKKSKIFIKAKLMVSKSCFLGLVYFMICCILRDAILLSLDLLKFQSLEFRIS